MSAPDYGGDEDFRWVLIAEILTGVCVIAGLLGLVTATMVGAIIGGLFVALAVMLGLAAGVAWVFVAWDLFSRGGRRKS